MTAQVALGLGIVGCGGAAADLVRAAQASDAVRVVGAYDRDHPRSVTLAASVGARAHRSLRALLADPAVDAVYVALPHDRLAPTALRALRAGRHVLVEKPGAIRLRDLEVLRAAEVAAGRSAGVLFELRQVASVRAAAALVRAGAIGPIRVIRIRTLIDKPATYWTSGPTGVVSDPWRASRRRAGGGVVLMNTIHQLDLVRAVTGLDVVRVAAETRARIARVEVEDLAVATLGFETGALGSLVADAHALGTTDGETIEIDGAEGSIRLGDPYIARPALDLWLRQPSGDYPANRWITIQPKPVDPWRAALDRFADAVRTGRPPVPGLDDAKAALATVLGIYRSARTGRFVTLTPPRKGG